MPDLSSLLLRSWKLLGKLFVTRHYDPDALDVVIAGYELLDVQYQSISTRKSVESLIHVSQYFVFFFV